MVGFTLRIRSAPIVAIDTQPAFQVALPVADAAVEAFGAGEGALFAVAERADADEGGVDGAAPFVVFDAVDVGVVVVVGAAGGADEMLGGVVWAVAAAGFDGGVGVWGIGAGSEGWEGWGAREAGFGTFVDEVGLVAEGWCVLGGLGGWGAYGDMDAGFCC